MSEEIRIRIIGDKKIDFSMIEREIINSEIFSGPVAYLIKVIEEQRLGIKRYQEIPDNNLPKTNYDSKQKDLKTNSV